MELSELQAFVTVVRANSFTAAADILDTDKAQVSRLVSRLESALGAQLLIRSTRSLAVTEVGKDVFERAVGVLAAVEETRISAARAQAAPTGLLKITCGEEFGVFVVSQWISRYAEAYPNMKVDVDLTNRVIDVVHEGFDLAIRVGSLPDSGLSARKLGEVDYGLFASPAYLTRKGEASSPDHLVDHDLLLPASSLPNGLQLRRGDEIVTLQVKPRLSANNNAMLRQATANHLGIALLPRFQAAPLVKTGALREILKGWSRPPVTVHAVFSPSRYLAPKVRAFVDLARANFSAALDLD